MACFNAFIWSNLLGDTIAAITAKRADAMVRVLECKAAAGESANEVRDLAMRVCGGAAFRKELGVERIFRDARAAGVMAPTTDVLYEFLGLDALLARRPENFNRALTPPEKKLLEAMLERGLGVQRKKPAVKKAPPGARKTAPRKTAAPKTPVGDPKDAPVAPTKRPRRKRPPELF